MSIYIFSDFLRHEVNGFELSLHVTRIGSFSVEFELGIEPICRSVVFHSV